MSNKYKGQNKRKPANQVIFGCQDRGGGEEGATATQTQKIP